MGTGGSKEEDDGLVAAAAAGKLRNTARILSEAPVADVNFDCPVGRSKHFAKASSPPHHSLTRMLTLVPLPRR